MTFQNAIRQGMNVIGQIAGQTVTYHAGNLSAQITGAVRGGQEFESFDENGAKLKTKLIDWLIFRDRLIVNNQLVEPTPGHRIVETVGNVTKTYEVQKRGDMGCYRLSGPTFDRYRIFVTEIQT